MFKTFDSKELELLFSCAPVKINTDIHFLNVSEW